jgi:hypothetical protein
MGDENPDWWSSKHTEDEWRAICEARAREFTSMLAEQRVVDEEKEARKDAWRELRNSMTIDEADAYIFNLTKLGMTQAAVARALGMTSVSQYMRRYKERNNVG